MGGGGCGCCTSLELGAHRFPPRDDILHIKLTTSFYYFWYNADGIRPRISIDWTQTELVHLLFEVQGVAARCLLAIERVLTVRIISSLAIS